jgi:hypothetical protein
MGNMLKAFRRSYGNFGIWGINFTVRVRPYAAVCGRISTADTALNRTDTEP